MVKLGYYNREKASLYIEAKAQKGKGKGKKRICQRGWEQPFMASHALGPIPTNLLHKSWPHSVDANNQISECFSLAERSEAHHIQQLIQISYISTLFSALEEWNKGKKKMKQK